MSRTRARSNTGHRILFMLFRPLVLTLVVVALALGFGCVRRDSSFSIPLGETTTRILTIAHGRGDLRFKAQAGQVLMVNRAGTGYPNSNSIHFYLDAKSDRLVLVPPGAGESSATRMGQDEDLGYWVGQLSRTGVYELVLHRSSPEPYRVRLTLMDPHDPRLDPGITPARVSIDLSLWGPATKLVPQPFYPPTFSGVDDNWPAQLAVDTNGLEFRIMSVDGIKKTLWEDADWMKGLSRLESALRPGGTVATPDLLPLSVYQDSHICFWGKQQTVEGRTWRGFRWIGWYAQACAGGPISGPLPMQYIFEAISRDGKYFIVMLADTAYLHPPLEWQGSLDAESKKFNKLIAPLPIGPERNRAIEALDREGERLLRELVNLRLNQAQPSSFKPDLRQLDAAVRTLELR